MFTRSLLAGVLSIAITAPLQTVAQTLPADSGDILKQGKQIALRAKAELGRNLKQAIESGGTVAAIEFCNERALPITQAVSKEQNAEITRASDQPRNPSNRADQRELDYIATAKKSMARGEAPKPALQQLDDRWVAYYPIPTDAMCLQCHGTPGEDVSPETLSVLNARYPGDEAVGYGVNELRGIWVISMAKDQVEAKQ